MSRSPNSGSMVFRAARRISLIARASESGVGVSIAAGTLRSVVTDIGSGVL